MNSPEGLAAIDYGILHPESKEAKATVKKLMPLILLHGSKVPFSPMERGTRGTTELLALCRYFSSFPNSYLTIGINEQGTAIIARLTWNRDAPDQPSTSAYHFWSRLDSNAEYVDSDRFDQQANLMAEAFPGPTDSVELFRKKIAQEIVHNPTAVALVCQRLMEAFN